MDVSNFLVHANENFLIYRNIQTSCEIGVKKSHSIMHVAMATDTYVTSQCIATL